MPALTAQCLANQLGVDALGYPPAHDAPVRQIEYRCEIQQPSPVLTNVMSLTEARSGGQPWKRRSSRFGAVALWK
ncbi:hypothetical protein BGLA2_430015 [Burkholderia gladioli]|nr:hypothetical protein BGLA2_430015 [Burkholderia gladioli]